MFVVVEVVTVAVLVELVVMLVELTVMELEVEADVAGVVEVELCSLALETLDETPVAVVTVEVVIAVDEDADAGEVVVEVIDGAPDGKLALATSPSRTATMTAAPALAPTFPN